MSVRTRYAPSPTGMPHLGNIRTALFDWLYARHNGGAFILRIEDTDQNRYVEDGVAAQMGALRWLGLEWDEGPDIGGPHAPYTQAERLPRYQEAAARLVALDSAYSCFCTVERLGELRAQQVAAKQPPGYDRVCRGLNPAERERRIASGEPRVIRFAVPLQGATVFDDAIRGAVSVENGTLDDFVILKSDGYPTYHLASVVDDDEMQISHVFRGEDWIPSAPRHVLVYDALGLEKPTFVHLPLILGPDRKKLGKRHGSTSVLDYREAGYLPEAVLNFLALLGWSYDDRTEIFSRDQLVEHFSLDRLNATSGIFDPDKLRWMNAEYIRALPEGELAKRLLPYLERELPQTGDPPTLEMLGAIAPLIQTRIEVLTDAYPLAAFFFTHDVLLTPGDLLGKRFAGDPTAALMALQSAAKTLAGLTDWSHGEIEVALRALGDELKLEARDFFGLLRMAVTGAAVSPPLFESLELLERDKTLVRLEHAASLLQADMHTTPLPD